MDAGRTLEQQRAAYALRVVEDVRKQSQDIADAFVAISASFPILAYSCGLGQALAFLACKKSRKNDNGDEKGNGCAYNLVLRCVNDWMCLENEHSPFYGAQASDLLHAIVLGSHEQYIVAQAEVLALMGWVKRCSKAYLDSKT